LWKIEESDHTIERPPSSDDGTLSYDCLFNTSFNISITITSEFD